MRLNNTKRLVSLFFLVLAVTSPVSAQSVDDFDDISAKMDLEFNTQAQRIDDIYDAVDQAIDRAFKGLTKRIEVKWPDGALPDRHRWVTYNASMSSRAIADFDKGELVVETIIEPGADIQEKLAELMAMSSSIATATPEQLDAQDVLREAVIKEVAEVTEASSEVIPSTESSIQTVLPIKIDTQLADLNEQLAVRMAEVEAEQQALAAPEPETKTKQLSAITAIAGPVRSVGGGNKPDRVKRDAVAPTMEADPAKPEQQSSQQIQTAATSSQQAPVETDEQAAPAAVMPVVDVVEEDGQTRLQLRIAFVNDYQEKLFGQYFNEIKAYAKQYDVPVSVIMAIIETESSFNPRAVSPIPAFGLMQLVPKTAGLDAHLFVHGEKKIVSADYLFNEENNLKLGSAYFHLLTHRYLRKISDPTVRFYCAVASYNTGVGNVAKTFTGKKSISAAVKAINQMAPGEVYDFLLTHLPAQETRNYLKKVVTRMEKYKQFDAKRVNNMKKSSSAALYLFALCSAIFFSAAQADEVVQQQPGGQINWSTGVISAYGYGVAPDDVPLVKQRLLARRAAQLDAYRNLAEMIRGVRVTSETVVEQMVTQSDTVKTSLETMIKGAAMTADHYQNDIATVTMTMSMDGRFIQMIAPHAAKTGMNTTAWYQAPVDWVLATTSNIRMPQLTLFPQAMASDSTQQVLVIDNPNQLELVKSITQLLKAQPQQQVITQLEQQIEFYESNSNFTGVLIDASQIGAFELATIPRIRNAKGDIIYPNSNDLADGNISSRPVSYDFDVGDAVRNARIAVKPFIIPAEGIYKSRNSDLVISDQAVALLKSQQTLLKALGNAEVMIVVAR